MNNKFGRWTVAVMMGLTSLAGAHPGPIGHIHEEEWPFDPIAAVALGVGVALVLSLSLVAWKKG